MANTETIPTSHTNGVIEDGYDEDDKSKMRPADIDADMREMERRKRVELIMNSRLFREELERIIESQMRDGNNSAGLLQQISDMVGSKYGTNNHILKNSSCVVPINDIRGIEAMGYAKGEKILRCKLAALFRLIELYGWSQNIYNHITARLSQQEEHFLVNPYGLLYSEITASSLVKVDMQGNVIETGTTNFSVHAGGFQLHAAIYAARPDLKCIVHLHTPSVLAVSSLKDGLLPLCQEAAVVGDVSHHAYIGVPNGPEERDKLVRNLGPNNKVIFLTNHGALCCGETIEETFFYVYNTVSACETQLKVMPFGKDNLILLSDETRKVMYDAARKMPENIAPNPNVPAAVAVAEKRWRVGGLEFEALMRMLDNAGFRTGYVYRQPLIKGEVPRPRNDVEVPPAVSSLGYLLEEEEFYRQGIWRKQNAAKGSDRIRWLNSPNVYQKVEILETGTTDPKKITKWVDANNEEWVAEGSPSHTSTPVKIENALQFVPKNTNPKEFKKLQQQIKDNRRADKITSGPQSHILEGVSWEEAKKLQDANAAGNSDQVILVGAASKGIIQREFQHNATVYKTPYAKNPFDAVTDEEIEKYKKDITRKQKGDSYYDEDESDALSSSLPPSGKNITGVTSEEDDSLAHEMRVIQIHTSTAPKASQAEVVLSDDGKKSKNKFVHSLGSMLTLRRDDTRYTQLSLLYTNVWEVQKRRAATIMVAVVELATYPTACPPPTRIRLDVNVDDAQPTLGLLMHTYLSETPATSYPKRMCQLIAGELAQRFRSGDVFGRRSMSALYAAHDVGSAHRLFDRRCYTQPAPVSIDSSEVEFTTLIEVPQHTPCDRLSESPHDFSSTTTEDEEDTPSTDELLLQLERTPSLKSVSSCVGAEYEGEEVRPPQMELQTLAEVTELTASFTTVSDDTSVDDVTVICRPPAPVIDLTVDDEDAGSQFSDDSQSMGSCSISSVDDDDNQLSDSNTYSCSDCVDDVVAADAIPVAPEELSTSFMGKDAKFKTELSVIYEEHGNVSVESVDGANTTHDEKSNVDTIVAGLSLTTADGTAKVPMATVTLKREPTSDFADLSARTVTMACGSEEAGSWPSAEASPSTFSQSLETVYEAVADDDEFSADDYLDDESGTDSALGATDLTFVAEPADSVGSYSVSLAVKKFVLCVAHVLNLVSALGNQFPPLDASPGSDSKPASMDSNTDPSSNTHSSAALVQQNSNSEGYTISDTSLISCIADSEEVAAAIPAPTFEECSELLHCGTTILIEDVATNSSCSEIEEENGDDNDKAFDNLAAEPLYADFHEEILTVLPAETSDHSWSEEEEGVFSSLLPAETSDLCQSFEYAGLPDVRSGHSGSDDGLPEEVHSSSAYEEKLAADKVASYYTICPKVIDCGQDDQLVEEVEFDQSPLTSDSAYQETDDLSQHVLNVDAFQSDHHEQSSVIAEEKSTVLRSPCDPNADQNASDIEDPEYSFPSHHSYCEEADAAVDSSDYFDSVEDASLLQFAQKFTKLPNEEKDCCDAADRNASSDSELASAESDFQWEDLLPYGSGKCFNVVEEIVSATSTSVSDVENENANEAPSDLDSASARNEDLCSEQLKQETFSRNEDFDEPVSVENSNSPPPLRAPDVSNEDLSDNVVSVESLVEDDQRIVLESHAIEAVDSISPVSEVEIPDQACDEKLTEAPETEVNTAASSISESNNLDQVYVEESIESASPEKEQQVSENPILQRLQAKADAVCLSFENFSVTDMLNTRCSSIQPTAEDKLVDDDEAEFGGSLETFDEESAFEGDFADEDYNGVDAQQQYPQPSDAVVEDDLLDFRCDDNSADISDADVSVVGDLAANAVVILADCVDWLFNMDEDIIENVVCDEYSGDHELDGSQIDSDINGALQYVPSDEAQEQCYNESSMSDVKCELNEVVAAPEPYVTADTPPELCEVVGRVQCDAANCSFSSGDSKIEYDVNSNQITCDGSPYVTAPQQQAGATSGVDAGAPTGGKSKQHRRSSSSSSSPDMVHIEGRCSRQGGGHNSATWCQSGDSMGELSLKLRLKVEWDSRPAANVKRSSSSSSGDGGAKRSFDDDSLNSSGSGGVAAGPDGSAAQPNGRTAHSKLLVEFKHNYPKFIQYSYFSPKVRRSPRRTPKTAPTSRVRKFGAAGGALGDSPQKNACHSADAAAIRGANCATLLSADSARIRAATHAEGSPSGQYLRFDDVTPGSWPSFAPTEATSKSSLLLDPRLEALSFKTSTPKGQQADDSAASCAQPPAMDSSLTEFEMWESLLESDQAVTR